MIRNWLRNWLGITSLQAGTRASLEAVDRNTDSTNGHVKLLEERSTLAWERIVAMEVEHSALSKKQAELAAILQEVRQLREMLADPKRQPIVARTTHQFRALMEQE